MAHICHFSTPEGHIGFEVTTGYRVRLNKTKQGSQTLPCLSKGLEYIPSSCPSIKGIHLHFSPCSLLWRVYTHTPSTTCGCASISKIGVDFNLHPFSDPLHAFPVREEPQGVP